MPANEVTSDVVLPEIDMETSCDWENKALAYIRVYQKDHEGQDDLSAACALLDIHALQQREEQLLAEITSHVETSRRIREVEAQLNQQKIVTDNNYKDYLEILPMAQRAELAEQQIERLTDLVRYQRHELHREKLISDEELAALVADSDSGQRVARLEGYDAVRYKAEQEKAKLVEALEEIERGGGFHESRIARIALTPTQPPQGEQKPKGGA